MIHDKRSEISSFQIIYGFHLQQVVSNQGLKDKLQLCSLRCHFWSGIFEIATRWDVCPLKSLSLAPEFMPVLYSLETLLIDKGT